jgi:hypothetical protein
MEITTSPLNAEAFAPFGDVVEAPPHSGRAYFSTSLGNLRPASDPKNNLNNRQNPTRLPYSNMLSAARSRPWKPPGVSIERIPEDRSLSEMLDTGEIDAVITPLLPSVYSPRSPRVRRLFPNFREVEREYYKKTGVFPIMHTVCIKTSLYEKHPWVAQRLYKAFRNSRDEAISRLHDTNALRISLPWVVAEAEESEVTFANGDF